MSAKKKIPGSKPHPTNCRTRASNACPPARRSRINFGVEDRIEALEQKLAKCSQELAEANKEIEAWSFSVSHDLRAPLRRISGFANALAEECGGKLDGQAKLYLERLMVSSRELNHLIDDLLVLGRLSRQPIIPQTVDLSAVARSISDKLQRKNPQRQAEFNIADDLKVNGDLRLLHVALEHLLGNAWKFTARNPAPRIEMGLLEKCGHPAYFIKDNGVGFDMNYLNKLFTPFQRLHAASEFPGAGLGLATVKRIFHRHNGCVWAEGHLNQGATFYFHI